MKLPRELVLLFMLAASSVSAGEPVSVELLSRPSNWATGLLPQINPSTGCPSVSVADFARGMGLAPAQSLAEFEQTVAVESTSADRPNHVKRQYHRVSPSVRVKIKKHHRIHAYYYNPDPNREFYWGFSGYLVALNGCVVHAETTSFDN